LSRSGFRGGEPVVVLYTAGGTGAWPVTSFSEIAHRMANNFNARIVVADEPSDQSFTTALENRIPSNAIRFAEPRALELMAAVARASVLITDEPNLGGVAIGMGTPVVDVAEPSHPAHRGVAGSKLAALTTEEVYEEAAEILQESRSTSLFRK
jgi:ADP-heptose:LPS heptosyltransferase